jgi:hypothetical protein
MLLNMASGWLADIRSRRSRASTPKQICRGDRECLGAFLPFAAAKPPNAFFQIAHLVSANMENSSRFGFSGVAAANPKPSFLGGTFFPTLLIRAGQSL